MKKTNEPIPPDFGYAKHPNLREWIERKYPQLDADETMEAFIDAAPEFKKHEAKDWQRRFRTVIRIAMVNKWTGICMPKKGYDIDMRWQETMAKARDIGFTKTKEGERRSSDTVDSYRSRMAQWEKRPAPSAQLFDFGALKKMV